MKKTTFILMILVFSLMFIPSAVAGTSMFDWEAPWIGQIPEINPAPWSDGQYATYNVTAGPTDEVVKADLRVALVGKETIDNKDYHWIELDLFNLKDLPKDLTMDEEFNSFRLKLLMSEYNFTFTKDNPEQVLQDLMNGEIVKRVIFQMNEDTPYEIDMSWLQMLAPMMEMQMQDMEGSQDEDVAKALEDMDWGYDTENVTTPAGTFADALKLWFNMGDESTNVKMNIYAHEQVPLSVLVKVTGKIEDTVSGDNFDVAVELAKYGNDAETWITGEPQMFSFDMMGGAPGMMGPSSGMPSPGSGMQGGR
jgi:hypothetical protein